MKKYVAQVSKEWGEIGFGSSKRDGWAWEVTYRVNGVKVDQHTYSSEAVAQENAALFEAGSWDYGSYGEVRIMPLGEVVE